MFCERFRVNKDTGERNFAMIQAEDELAAAGMVIGAGWAGARAFTSTAGPGISLMEEFIGLAYYAEIPAVFFDVQRTGPSTGMPTRTQQGDLMSVAYASHGDTKHIALYPSDPGECFYMAARGVRSGRALPDPGVRRLRPRHRHERLDGAAPGLGRRLRAGPRQGAVADELEKIEKFARYLDVDGDGIAARTLPGVHPKGAYFTRGSGHDQHGAYTEDADEYQEVVDRIARKIDGAAAAVPAPGDPAAAGRRGGHRLDRRLPRGRAGGVDRLEGAGRSRRLHAHPGLPLRCAGRPTSCDDTTSCSSSSRTAMPSSARCSPSRPACRAIT